MKQSINQKFARLFPIWIALGLSLLTLLPLTKSQFFQMHDYTHVARLVEMKQALADGHFPVRWSKDLGFGYGLPQFSFYGPLPYYLGALLMSLSISAIGSVKLIVLLNFVASYGLMYILAKRYWGKMGGVIAASAFIFLPYRSVDFYVRGAIGELSAMTCLVLVALGIDLVIEKPTKNRLVLLAIGVLFLMLSHNITAMIGLPLITSWIMVTRTLTQVHAMNRKTILTLGAGLGLGLMLACFYWLPALTEKDYTLAESLTQGFSYYGQHFLYLRQLLIPHWGYGGSIYGLDDNLSFEIGNVHLILLLSGGVGLLLYRKRSRNLLAPFVVGALFTILAVLLTTFKTQFIWDRIPLMAYVQFPWRFLAIIGVMVSFLTGRLGSVIEKQHLRHGLRWLFGFGSILLLMGYNLRYFHPETYLNNNLSLYYTDPTLIAGKMSEVIPDFIPKHQQILPLNVPQNRFEIDAKPLDLENIWVNRTHEFLLDLHRFSQHQLRINIAYFPGWKLFINGQETKFKIEPETGAMLVDLPLKTDTLLVSGLFTETPIRRFSDLVSLIGLFLVIWLILPLPSKRKINNNV